MSKESERGSYPHRVLLGFDQFVNTICGGDPDETLSARAWRNKDKTQYWGVARIVIDTIFFWQPDHCYRSYLWEKNHGHKSNQYDKEGK